MRPGEKLYEELLVGDNPWGTDHPRILCAEEYKPSWESVKTILNQLVKACDRGHCESVRELILNSDTDYSPNETISDWVWNKKITNRKEAKKESEKDKVVSVFSSEKEKTTIAPSLTV